MCGRCVNYLVSNELVRRTNATRFVNASSYRPSHNVCPNSRNMQPLLMAASASSSFAATTTTTTTPPPPPQTTTTTGSATSAPQSISQLERELVASRWGVLSTKETHSAPSNAVSETMEGSALWAPLLDEHRAVLVCQGYYEWQTEGLSKIEGKRPYYIRHKDKDELMYLAALYKQWTPPDETDGTALPTFAVITTSSSNHKQLTFHHRMPVVLRDEAVNAWLDPTRSYADVAQLIREPYVGELEVIEVSQQVNKSTNDSPSNIEPVKKARITSFFKASPQKRADFIKPASPQKKQKH